MDENEYVKLQACGFRRDFSRFNRIYRFLLSVFSVFSLALAFSLFPHSFSVCFSTYLFSLFTHAIDRKYMFLLCNGILFLLAGSSLDSESSFSFSEFEHLAEEDSDSGLAMKVEEEETEAEEVAENGFLQTPYKQLEAENLIEEVEEDGDYGDEEENEVSLKGEEEEEAAATTASEEVVLSTEELNKKIEEFIRKMKEEMRIEAKTQLIAV